eukprot:gene16071-22208_t
MPRALEASEGGDGETGSASDFSTERNTMKEQLESVRMTLNTLSHSLLDPLKEDPASGTRETAQLAEAGTALSSVTPGLESLLEDVAFRLNSIEHLYTDLSSRLNRVDGRVIDTERTMRQLQHVPAGTVSETARPSTYMEGMRNSASSPMANSSNASGIMASPVGSQRAGARDYPHSPAAVQLSGTVQQHASHIHKLIAGLDFLEQHIVRQDQVIDNVQKQVLVFSQDQARSPSEPALQVHGLSELLNNMSDLLNNPSSHMYNAHAFKALSQPQRGSPASARYVRAPHQAEITL